MTHETRVRAVAVAFGAVLVVVGLLGIGLASWRRARGLPSIEEVLAFAPLGVVLLAFVVYVVVVRRATDYE